MKRQYIGNLGKIENGIVAVTAYGMIEDMTFPLTFQIYKLRERLQPRDKYKTKPEIAAELIRELQGMGFKFELVLADSLYGESDGNFIMTTPSPFVLLLNFGLVAVVLFLALSPLWD